MKVNMSTSANFSNNKIDIVSTSQAADSTTYQMQEGKTKFSEQVLKSKK